MAELIAHLDDLCVFHWLFVLIIPTETRVQQCTIFWLALDQTNELGGGEARSLDKEVGREELDRQERQSWKRWKIFPHRRNIIVSQQPKVVDRLIS